MKAGKSVRLTRGLYKKKLIMFGVSIFSSLALISTGFATWVLSKDTNMQTDGEVKVGAVTEANVEIKDIVFVDKDTNGADIKNFIFEPQAGDTTGRVRYDGQSAPEDLDLGISFEVTNYQNVDSLFVQFKLPQGVKNAIDAGFITLPSGFEIKDDAQTEIIDQKTYYVATYKLPSALTTSSTTEDGLVVYEITEAGGGVKTAKFTMTLKFAWGSMFNGDNPGIYYDTSYENDTDGNQGLNVPYETMKATLNRFKATMHGIEYNAEFEALSEDAKTAKYNENPIGSYYVIVNATVA